jgi:hypothetical protein
VAGASVDRVASDVRLGASSHQAARRALAVEVRSPSTCSPSITTTHTPFPQCARFKNMWEFNMSLYDTMQLRSIRICHVCVSVRNLRRFRGRRARQRVQQRTAAARVWEGNWFGRPGSHTDGQPIDVVSRPSRPLTCQGRIWLRSSDVNESAHRSYCAQLAPGSHVNSPASVRAGFQCRHRLGSIQARTLSAREFLADSVLAI